MNLLNKKVILPVLLLVILVMIAAYQREKVNEYSPVVEIKDAKCLVDENMCSVENETFKLKIILDKNITYLKPFNVIVTSETKKNFKIDKIQIDFKMQGMDMGVNRFLLKTGDMEAKKQQWYGSGLLPICVSGRADWVAELEVYTSQSRFSLKFPVVVKKVSN